MSISRSLVLSSFAAYTAAYDITDEKIKLKVNHTYRVASLCEQIAKSIGMTGEDLDLAWACGMLHDIGRFEQVRIYGTFSDAESVDHAQFGADILFVEGKIKDYLPDADRETLYVLETAIRNHSNWRVAEGLDGRTEIYCHILRDADKIDILRVNIDTPLEDIYNTTTELLRNAEVSEAVMQSFSERHATKREIRETPVDFVVGHISLVYELVYEESRRIVVKQGYLDQLLNFESKNPKTMQQFKILRKQMEEFLDGLS